MRSGMATLGRVRPTGRLAGRPASYLSVLSEGERVLYVHPEIPHRAFDVRVAQEKLHRPQIASSFVDDGRLSPPKRMGAVVLASQPDRGHPLVHQPGILPSAEVAGVVSAARERVIVDRAASSLKPSLQTGPSRFEQLELDLSRQTEIERVAEAAGAITSSSTTRARFPAATCSRWMTPRSGRAGI